MSKLILRVDGSCIPNPGNMAIGVVIYEDNKIIKKINELAGFGTNNIAEYKAVIRGLEEIKGMNFQIAEFYCDSQLVVKQLNKQFKIKNENIIPLYNEIKTLLKEIKNTEVYFYWNSREENKIADQLARSLLIKKTEDQKSRLPEEDIVLKAKKEKPISEFNDDFTGRKNLNNETEKHKINILIFSKMLSPVDWKTKLQNLNEKHSIPFNLIFPENGRENLKDILKISDIIIGGKLTNEDLKLTNNLKLYQIPYSGLDNLDLSSFKDYPEIFICNTHSNSNAVSEHAICLLLALAKKLIKNDSDLRKGKWNDFLKNEKNIELTGKKLGIIGLGSIGLEIAKKANIFGMDVLAIKRNAKNKKKLEKKYKLQYIGDKDDIEFVIKNSDFIVVTVPLTKQTENIINEKILSQMKNKYLINISRGKVVEEKILYKYLENKFLAGAAIDVWYQYPEKNNSKNYPSKYNFHKLDNVIMSPHVAGYTEKAIEENVLAIYKNIIKVANCEKPDNIISIELGY
ncbi:MAG: NAD(P)-dependent oxidoreductase [Atribacterota bacterium]|nr:NAD(P)-dependent oxidoreductase [Atribacterota bacterium]